MLRVKKRHRKPLQIVAIILGLAIAGGSYYAYTLYEKIFSSNTAGTHPKVLYIRPGVSYADILDTLAKYNVVKDMEAFRWVSDQMAWEGPVPPGRYVIPPGLNNREMVNLFRGGMQTPVLVPIVKERTLDDLATHLSQRLLFNKSAFMQAVSRASLLDSLGVTHETVIGLFLTDSYSLYWTTSPTALLWRMHEEYHKWWTPERVQQAKNHGLTPMEAITLASIVEEETAQPDEKATVAGLYLNRLERGMRLQADPTVKYAVGDFSIKRVLYVHLEKDSPYNTYKYAGLPPGPICIPFKSTIEAVLQAEDHNYIYMCARPDFSGYHNFARTARQHARNRNAYIRALNQRRIYE